MSPLEQQVTSLEPSKRLKELGVKQDSLWYWGKRTFANGVDVIDKEKANSSSWVELCSAFTVAEHGEALDVNTVSGKIAIDEEDAKKYCCLHFSIPEFEVWDERTRFADKEADARAKMRIWLIENKLVEANKKDE